MFGDDLPKPKTFDFPRNLENMSLSELEAYVAQLHAEIDKVKADMVKKKASQDAAAAFFK